MKSVLIVGSGGREHALAWKLSLSAQVDRVVCAPGNDCWDPQWDRWPETDFEALAVRAKLEKIDLVVVGPDQPLAQGLVDVLSRHGVLAFGPSAQAAKLESSKAFAKEVMRAAGVPTAKFKVFESAQEVRGFLQSAAAGPAIEWLANGVVLKLDGLALGKGVRVCPSPFGSASEREEVLRAVSELEQLGGKSAWVLEERLEGEELSWLAICDGTRAALLEPARDYKRVGTGDIGLNTGGMGAYSPVEGVDASLFKRVQKEVFTPVLREMKKRGMPFKGVLYAGLMWNRKTNRYWVLEFNARFGDPETQVLLPRMKDDLFKWCEAAAKGNLSKFPARVGFSKKSAVVVIAAASGYPENVKKGDKITAPPRAVAPSYFWAGAQKTEDFAQYQVSGGRVCGAAATGASLMEARKGAYRALSHLKFEGLHFRHDIASQRERPRVAVFASGRGSNFEALAKAIRSKKLKAEIVCLVTDKRDAGVIARAKKFKVPVLVIEKNTSESKTQYEANIIEQLKPYYPRFVILAGFMKVLSPSFLRCFASERGYYRVVNIHPSLLPAFAGVGGYAQAFEYGAKVAGATVHLVDEGLDSGPICAQESFSIEDCLSSDEVEARGLQFEHGLYIKTLKWVLNEEFKIESAGGRKRVRAN